MGLNGLAHHRDAVFQRVLPEGGVRSAQLHRDAAAGAAGAARYYCDVPFQAHSKATRTCALRRASGEVTVNTASSPRSLSPTASQ